MEWYKQKTTWTGIAGLVSAIGGHLTGSMPSDAAINLALTSIAAIFLRQAVAKGPKE